MSDDLKGVLILKSYYDAIIGLDDEDRLELYDAIFNYGFNDDEPTFTKKYLNSQWILIKPNLDNSINRYKASTENGKKGGRPPKKKVLTNKDRQLVKNKVQDNIKILDNFLLTGELYDLNFSDISDQGLAEIEAIIKETEDKLNKI